MGVTKQAAQKRFVPKDPGQASDLDPNQGFSRFTPRARQVVVVAQNEARAARTAEILPPASHPRTPGRSGRTRRPSDLRAGRDTGFGPARRDRDAAPPAVEEVPALIPFDAQSRKALELTFREALRLGHNYIGTEHILLALLEVEDGVGVLTGLGVDKARAEENIAANLDAIVAAREKE